MFPQILRKKISALGISPLGMCLLAGALICLWGFGKTSSSPEAPTPKLEKSGAWLKISQAGNLKLCETLAKKEQLEKDLTIFHPIASAKVALALPSDSEVSHPLKLSVILTLHKDQYLTPMLLFSIADYLCSSFPGLRHEDITLSDNDGNFYTPELIDTNFLLLFSLEKYLSKIFPKEHFSLSCLPKKEKPTLQLTVNKTFLEKLSKEHATKLWNHATQYLYQNYGTSHTILTEQLPFTGKLRDRRDISRYVITGLILLSSLSIVALASLYLAWQAYDRMDEPQKIKRGINIAKLVEIVQKEPPQKIALILSFLDPGKADELLNKLPIEIQHQVLKYKL